jgi:hypothetical protein
VSLSDWLGISQAILTLAATILTALATYFAWQAVTVASQARREAADEKRLARLESLRAILGELERLKRFGGDTRKLEDAQDRLGTLLPSAGGHRKLPATTGHWHPRLENAEELLDAALAELDAAIADAA